MSSGADTARPARPARSTRSSLFEPVRPVGSLGLGHAEDIDPDTPAARGKGLRATGTRLVPQDRAPRPGGSRSGSTTAGRGAHRAPAPRRAPGRTRMVVAGTASLAGLSAIVTGVALTGEHAVTNAGPTTGATPLIQVDEARQAFGSDDAQASRGSREPLLPPQVSDPTGDTLPTGSGPSTSTGPIGQEYGYQHYTRQNTPAPPANPGTTGEEGLSGYEIPFVPLTPQTSAAPTPAGTTPPAGTTSDPATGGAAPGTTPGATPGGTTTGGTTTAPGTATPGGTATPQPTTPATKPASGGTTTPTTPRPSSSASTTPPPSTTPEDEEEGSLPFNPEPVQVTPIWDSLFPPAASGSTATSSSATR